MIKRILMVLGGIFVLLIISFIIFAIKGSGLDRESQAYASESVLAISKDWDYEELKRRIDPILFTVTAESTVRDGFKVMARLGKLQSLQDCQGHAVMNIANGQPPVTAQYACKVKYESDFATVYLFLIKESDNSWKIGGFHIDSNYLIKAVQ